MFVNNLRTPTWILFGKTLLLQLPVIRFVVAAPINLADRVCSYFYAHSSFASVEGSFPLVPPF